MTDNNNQLPPLVEVPNYHEAPNPSAAQSQQDGFTSAPAASTVYPTQPQQANADLGRITQRIHSGASWISAVGIFSFLNTVLGLFKATIRFVIGLGATQIIDYIAVMLSQRSDNHTLFIALNVGLNLLIAAIFVILGWFAKRDHSWAWLAGMALYLIDTAIIVWIQYWPGLIFHIIALVMMIMGFIALRKKQKLLKASSIL